MFVVVIGNRMRLVRVRPAKERDRGGWVLAGLDLRLRAK